MSKYPGPRIVPAPCIHPIDSSIAPRLKNKSLDVLLLEFIKKPNVNTDNGIIRPNNGSSSCIQSNKGVCKSLTKGVMTPARPNAIKDVASNLLNKLKGFLLNDFPFIKKI